MAEISPRSSNALHGVALPSAQAKDKFSGTYGREKATRELKISYDGTNSYLSLVPDLDDPHPASDWLKFKNYSLTQLSNTPQRALLVLSYVQDEFGTGGGAPPLPDLPVEEPVESSGVLEIDISRHPKWDTANPAWSNLSLRDFYNPREQRIFMGPTIPATYIDEDGNSKANPNAGETVPVEIRGMEKYVVGTGTVTVREYSYNQPTHVIPDSGKRGVPTGYPGTTANWLIMSGTRAMDGAFWYRDIEYQYSGKDISGWVYDDV